MLVFSYNISKTHKKTKKPNDEISTSKYLHYQDGKTKSIHKASISHAIKILCRVLKFIIKILRVLLSSHSFINFLSIIVSLVNCYSYQSEQWSKYKSPLIHTNQVKSILSNDPITISGLDLCLVVNQLDQL